MNSPAAWEEIQQIIFPSRWHRNGFFYPMGYWGPADKKRIFRRLLIASIHREKKLKSTGQKNLHILVFQISSAPSQTLKRTPLN